MKREEAINLIGWLKSTTNLEAIDMAIEALQREDNLLKSLETNEPIYDMVDVVRCKDCRWWNGSQETMHNNHLCRNWSKFGSIDTSADDFCSCGERKGGDEK